MASFLEMVVLLMKYFGSANLFGALMLSTLVDAEYSHNSSCNYLSNTLKYGICSHNDFRNCNRCCKVCSMLKSIFNSIFISVSLLMVASPGVVIGQARPDVETTAPWDDGGGGPPAPGTYSKSKIHMKKNFRSSVSILALIFKCLRVVDSFTSISVCQAFLSGPTEVDWCIIKSLFEDALPVVGHLMCLLGQMACGWNPNHLPILLPEL
jgi:hypothetical protein